MSGQQVGYLRVSSLDQNPARQLEGCEWSNYLAHLDRAIWRYPRLVTTLRRAHTAAGDRPGRPM